VTVFARTLRPFAEPLTARRRRFLVVWRYSRQQVFSSRLLTAFYALCFAPLLIAGGYIYLRYNLPVLEAMNITAQALPPVDERFFFNLLRLQGFFAFLLAAFIAPGLMAPDLADNALPLYLARPLSRGEYVLGKMTVLGVVLSAVTWLPLVALLGFEAGLQDAPLTAAQLRIGGALLVGSGLWVLLVSLFALAISSWVRWKTLAAAVLFGFFFITRAMAALVNFNFKTSWGYMVSPDKQMTTIWEGLFFGASSSGLPPAAAWLGLVALCGFCLLVLNRKLRAYEVVK